MTRDTERKLEEWARWVRVGSPEQQLRYKSPMGHLMRQKVGSVLPTPMITDEDAERVDRAVARLVIRRPEMGHLLIAYYVDGESFSRIGREHRISREQVSTIVRAAVCWVDGVLTASEQGLDLRAAGM